MPPKSAGASGIVCFIDVLSEDGADLSSTLADKAQALGIRVLKKFTNSVTHLVHWRGDPARLAKAQLNEVSVVTREWLLQSHAAERILPEADFLMKQAPEPDSADAAKQRREAKAMATSTLDVSLSRNAVQLKRSCLLCNFSAVLQGVSRLSSSATPCKHVTLNNHMLLLVVNAFIRCSACPQLKT
jgi:BRCA1 C Terminus (BRCT) domain